MKEMEQQTVWLHDEVTARSCLWCWATAATHTCRLTKSRLPTAKKQQ